MLPLPRVLIALALTLVLTPMGSAVAADPDVVYFPIDVSDVEFANDYGVRAKGRVHQGVDLFADEGSEVVAIADGFIDGMRYGSRPGWYVVIRHADQTRSWYLHLDDDSADGQPFPPDLSVGDFVAAGALVGYVGDSGNAAGTAPHVHFELHVGGSRVNPYPHLLDAQHRSMELARLVGFIQ